MVTARSQGKLLVDVAMSKKGKKTHLNLTFKTFERSQVYRNYLKTRKISYYFSQFPREL